MVVSTGLDIVKIARIEKLLETRKERFYNKIFTRPELDYIYRRKESPETIAGLFASKEAIGKLLGRGIGLVAWQDIEIYHDKFGKPQVRLDREGENLRRALGIETIHLSISHEKDYALALAIGQGGTWEGAGKALERDLTREFSRDKQESLKNRQEFCKGWAESPREGEEFLLGKRKVDSHKGDYGRLGIIAGSSGMVGSACLVAMAALRSGTGLVYNIVPQSLGQIFAIKLLEPIIIPVADDGKGYFNLASREEIARVIEDKDVLALGPGLGLDDERIKLVEDLLLSSKKPIVLDADGINCLAQDPSILLKRGGATIITPHPGEMARLLNTSIGEIQENRIKYSKFLSNKYNIITVLKGHETVVTNGRDFYINETGNPGMATAGSGDVLTGIIASFLGQGMEDFQAAKLGVYVHGLAGDLAKNQKGEYGLIAGDLLDYIPQALNKLET